MEGRIIIVKGCIACPPVIVPLFKLELPTIVRVLNNIDEPQIQDEVKEGVSQVCLG